jgi:hypothetical protein
VARLASWCHKLPALKPGIRPRDRRPPAFTTISPIAPAIIAIGGVGQTAGMLSTGRMSSLGSEIQRHLLSPAGAFRHISLKRNAAARDCAGGRRHRRCRKETQRDELMRLANHRRAIYRTPLDRPTLAEARRFLTIQKDRHRAAPMYPQDLIPHSIALGKSVCLTPSMRFHTPSEHNYKVSRYRAV